MYLIVNGGTEPWNHFVEQQAVWGGGGEGGVPCIETSFCFVTTTF